MSNVRPQNVTPRLLVSLLALAALAGCQKPPAPASYDDCVLLHIHEASNQAAIQAVQQSCLGKFPPAFDWEELAKQAGRKSWTEVLKNPEFQNLSLEDKRAAKEQYWQEVIKPRIRQEFMEVAHTRFVVEP